MTEKQKILIVDDDENIAELISLYLTKECFDTNIVGDGSAALEAVASYQPDLVLLDIMLPGINGYDVLREIRKTSSLPVIMLSAKGETFDKVLGLELGADDYIMKPFDTKELMARIKAVLRRAVVEVSSSDNSDIPKECVNYPGLMINLTDYSVYYNKERVERPPKELELFYFLASHPNQVFTREQLLDNIWSYDYIGDTRTVDVHIKRLREKFPQAEKWQLATVWGVGYKFEYHD
jgi:DNA-binding response OmpR family regulator